MFNRILFPTSGSPIAPKMAKMICQLIKEDTEREVLILTVAQIPSMPSNVSMLLDHAGVHVEDVVLEDIKERVEKVTTIFEENDIPYKVKIASGEPINTILKEADNFKADLLILGHHGESTFTDFLFKGNITVQLINEANCPVMVVK
ncbi:universal stress protein [Desulfuribacillus alkaliarsenatis]|uniref:UspA domain-containing protein n=1 Tax=Desulfuribacillus alkaliarsenatis TaxID=766136 RepID=A0A1E5G5K7_9FIRM|nr:universal stress protein [Desulfuribacillus alkaliarsenatis]OEF98458.1 hypothetical protein BHF68_01930 [Desulfuribacillus alkaliarsenatis]